MKRSNSGHTPGRRIFGSTNFCHIYMVNECLVDEYSGRRVYGPTSLRADEFSLYLFRFEIWILVVVVSGRVFSAPFGRKIFPVSIDRRVNTCQQQNELILEIRPVYVLRGSWLSSLTNSIECVSFKGKKNFEMWKSRTHVRYFLHDVGSYFYFRAFFHLWIRVTRLGEFSPFGRLLTLGSFFFNYRSGLNLMATFFTWYKLCMDFDKNCVWPNVGRRYRELIWSPCYGSQIARKIVDGRHVTYLRDTNETNFSFLTGERRVGSFCVCLSAPIGAESWHHFYSLTRSGLPDGIFSFWKSQFGNILDGIDKKNFGL
jgi:hypothetical protein